MPKTIKKERLGWVLPIFNKEIKLRDAAKVYPHSERSLERWLVAYHRRGEASLVLESTKPKSNPRETPIRIKERIIELRKQNKMCSRKLSWQIGRLVFAFLKTLFFHEFLIK